MRKAIIAFMLVLSVLSMDSSVVLTAPLVQGGVQPAVEPTPDALPGGLTPNQIQFEFGDLAEAVEGETLPPLAQDPNLPPDAPGLPAHIRFSFGTDVLSEWFSPMERQLLVYPVAEYEAIYEQGGQNVVADRVDALRALIDTQPQTIDDPVPVLPLVNAQQVLKAQVKYVNFTQGAGVRFVTYYSQALDPLINGQVFYTFQGLTSDNQYYIAFFYPISASTLPNSYQETDAAKDPDGFVKRFDSYLQATVQSLNELADSGYTPSLEKLDTLVQSLQLGYEMQPQRQRVQFAPGMTSARVKGVLPANGTAYYALRAMAEQNMTVKLSSEGAQDPGAILIIYGQDGDVLISDHAGATVWSGDLPSTQDYFVDVRSVNQQPVDYTMEVEILPLSK